ncbi:MAG: hypothetical protein OQK59_09590 [Chlorobium sp.]|nr:hypothetical protein [Chlorobium sp.]
MKEAGIFTIKQQNDRKKRWIYSLNPTYDDVTGTTGTFCRPRKKCWSYFPILQRKTCREGVSLCNPIMDFAKGNQTIQAVHPAQPVLAEPRPQVVHYP